ncbi:Zinc finger C2H2-type, partial [Trinorchestia longiramus]
VSEFNTEAFLTAPFLSMPFKARRPATRPGLSGPVVPFEELTGVRPMSIEKPYPCPVCQMPFYDKAKFRHHYMVHTGERPYSCSFCSFKARQVGNLNRHIKEKHR